MRTAKWDISHGWEPAEPPDDNPGRKPEKRTKTMEAVELVERFVDSGDECWAKRCRVSNKATKSSKEAESNCTLLRQVAAASGQPVRAAVRKDVLYLMRTE